MSLRGKRRRKRERRRIDKRQPTRRWEPASDVREVDDASVLPGWTPRAAHELETIYGTALRAPRDLRDADELAPTASSSSRGLREAGEVERLAYTRRQAAEALGVSISTIDRRIVPAIHTVKLPWGQRLIPVDELERFLRNHLAPARARQARRPAGRPPTLPASVVERIRLEYARGRGLSDIARALTAQGVPTAHGGRQWWPSTVRAVLVRPSPAGQTEELE
jgi:Recombinase